MNYIGIDVHKSIVRREATRRIAKRNRNEVARGFIPPRPYQDMRSEQSEGMELLGRSGEARTSTGRTARVNRDGRT